MCALLGYRRGLVALLVIAAQLLPSRVLTAQEIDPKTGEATPVVSAAEKAYLVAKARTLEKINAVRRTNLAEAIRLTRVLLRSDQDTFGPNHEHSVTTLNLLAVLYWDSGDLKTAASCQVAIMEIRENLYGKDDWRRNEARWNAEKWKHLASTNDFALAHADAKAAALVNEATQAYADRNYAATIAAAQNAAKIYKDVYGDNVPSYAEAINLIAICLADQGKYTEAQQVYEQVSAIYQGWHGTISPMYGRYRSYLGLIARTDAERERYYRQAIDIFDQIKGCDRTFLANALDGLAWHYLNVGRYAQGEELIVRAMGIEEAIRGPQSPALKNMQIHAAGIYRNLGKFAESESLFKSLQAYYDADPNQFASERTIFYDEMGRLYLAQKKYDLAEREIRALRERLLAEYVKHYGKDCPLVRRCEIDLKLDKQVASFGPVQQQNYLSAEGHMQAAKKFSEADQNPAAADAALAAADLYRKLLGDDSLKLAGALTVAGNCHDSEDRTEALYREALKIRQTKLGEQDILTASLHRGLGASLVSQNRSLDAIEQLLLAAELYKLSTRIA